MIKRIKKFLEENWIAILLAILFLVCMYVWISYPILM